MSIIIDTNERNEKGTSVAKKLKKQGLIPVVIYNNNSFISPKLEMKYLPIIQNKINKKYVKKYSPYEDTGIFTSIEEIINVVKKEERYDPYEANKLYL